MTLSPTARWCLRLGMAIGLAFIYVPLGVVLVNSFNADRTFGWPPPAFTGRWWQAAWDSSGVRAAASRQSTYRQPETQGTVPSNR